MLEILKEILSLIQTHLAAESNGAYTLHSNSEGLGGGST